LGVSLIEFFQHSLTNIGINFILIYFDLLLHSCYCALNLVGFQVSRLFHFLFTMLVSLIIFLNKDEELVVSLYLFMTAYSCSYIACIIAVFTGKPSFGINHWNDFKDPFCFSILELLNYFLWFIDIFISISHFSGYLISGYSLIKESLSILLLLSLDFFYPNYVFYTFKGLILSFLII
jgi:hypothetical protein